MKYIKQVFGIGLYGGLHNIGVKKIKSVVLHVRVIEGRYAYYAMANLFNELNGTVAYSSKKFNSIEKMLLNMTISVAELKLYENKLPVARVFNFKNESGAKNYIAHKKHSKRVGSILAESSVQDWRGSDYSITEEFVNDSWAPVESTSESCFGYWGCQPFHDESTTTINSSSETSDNGVCSSAICRTDISGKYHIGKISQYCSECGWSRKGANIEVWKCPSCGSGIKQINTSMHFGGLTIHAHIGNKFTLSSSAPGAVTIDEADAPDSILFLVKHNDFYYEQE